MDRLDKLAAPRTSPDCPFMLANMLDMFRSDMGDELDKSGHVCDDGLLIFGHESELTIVTFFKQKLMTKKQKLFF